MKQIFLGILMVLIFVGGAFAATTQQINFTTSASDSVSSRASSAPNLKVNMIRQDPLPANPGQIVDLYFNINNIGGTITGPKFELITNYPFTIDPSSTSLDKYATIASGEKVTLHYKLKIDDKASPGNYELEFRPYFGNNYYPSFFEVAVDDVQSTFDLAVQEITSEGVSFALSNTGKNDASSITLSLEQNPNFEVLGFDSFIIGNLNAGDYTLINALIAPKENVSLGQVLPLNLKIAYTDIVGNRREVVKQITLPLTEQAQKGFLDMKAKILAIPTQDSGGFNFFLITTIVLIVALGYVMWRHKKKIKNLERE